MGRGGCRKTSGALASAALIAAVGAAALATAIVAARARADDPPAKGASGSSALATVTSVSVAGGVNEGGSAGQVSIEIETRGIERLRIKPSELALSITAGQTSHLVVDASIMPIELKAREYVLKNGSPGRLEVTFTPVTANFDSTYHTADHSKSDVDSYFTAPVQVEQTQQRGPFTFSWAAFLGPTAGALCNEHGCVSLPAITPSLGGEASLRVALSGHSAIELALKATYLVSTDTSIFATDNGSADGHIFFVHTLFNGDDWYLGPQVTFDNKDAKRVDDAAPTRDLQYGAWGVAGVRFRAPGEPPPKDQRPAQ